MSVKEVRICFVIKVVVLRDRFDYSNGYEGKKNIFKFLAAVQEEDQKNL